ncbi:MAG: hypothetical protein JW745_08980 [Sedimentisphaerales bacterium]|nr:hypothetical protein [Sedimentisphaerales bacterium]MBN2843302.1 hypothetical protein [Sedimentisphaerales bacterium]
MAKMFYSIEEVQEKLGCTGEKIKEFVKEGMLREFRDGMKVLFKVDEVDSLASSSALSSSDSGALPLNDENSFDDMPLDLDGSSIGLAPSASSAGDSFSDDSAVDDSPLALNANDDMLAGLDDDNMLAGSSIGLASSGSGYGLKDSNDDSVGLADQIDMEDAPLSNDKDDTVVTSHGIDALEDTEMDMDVDPLAQTKISSPFAIEDDEISIDPSSSGSGLLDLSREADDTSLGADILKDIYSSDDLGDADDAPVLQAAADEDEPEEASSVSSYQESVSAASDNVAAPVMVMRGPQIYDPTSGVFGFMLVVAFIMLFYFVINASVYVTGIQPSYLKAVNDNMLYVSIGAGAVVVLIALYGFFLAGNSSSRPSGAKKEKAEKKPSKAKESKVKAKKIKKKK